MSTALELIYQYRQLIGKCEAGVGLSFDEIDALSAIEALFERRDEANRSSELWSCRRRFLREDVYLDGWVRATRLDDRVTVANLAPGGAVITSAPTVPRGELVELKMDDRELELSYRFKARASWVRSEADGSFSIGLRFEGTPLLIHYGPRRRADTAVDDVGKVAA